MKVKEAIQLAHDCGMYSLAEAVNNVLFHSTQLFPYESLRSECDELVADAKKRGVEFHGCGAAMLHGKCYMCEKMANIKAPVSESVPPAGDGKREA